MPIKTFSVILIAVERAMKSATPRFLPTLCWRGWGCVASAVLLAGCAATQPPAPATPSSAPSGTAAPRNVPNVNLSGYPPAFKEGFADGCESLRGTYRRDANRFGKDNNYTLGWQDGYSICGRQKR